VPEKKVSHKKKRGNKEKLGEGVRLINGGGGLKAI